MISEAMKYFAAFLIALLLVIAGFANSVQKPPVITYSIAAEAGAVSASDTLEWDRPRFSERQDEREELVQSGVIEQGITDPDVIEAMLNVPRHLFVPENQRHNAYQNNPLPIGHGQTISQPYIVALMAEMLEVEPGDKVLEIGTGSGYHAAVLSELTPYVYSIEIVEPLGRQAGEVYEELGYHTIETKIGDGYYGWEEYAPFDKIIVTAAAGHVPPPLLDQLKPGGIIAIPVGSPYQTQILMRVIKSEDGDVRTERVLPVRFVPMTGAAQEQE
jgi:protein-L-isoaspartate(D-aspartate) O-methyltransferase